MHVFYDAGNYVSKYEESHLDFSYNRSDSFIKFIDKRNKKIKNWLDLACGTGSLLGIVQERLNLQNCIGLDFSKKMLAYAKKHVKNNNIKFIYGDMTNFELDKKFDIITCNYNAINELFPLNKWERVFNLAYNHLNNGGLFSFDINTIYKFKGGIRVFHKSTDKYDIVSKFIPNKDNSIEYVTITYDKNKEGFYKKEEIHMTEYVYKVSEIKKALKRVGFKNIIIGDQNFKKCNLNKSRRLYIICEK